MGAEETTRGAGDPAALYSEQLNALQRSQSADQRQERLLGYAKVAVAFTTIAAALILLYYVRFLSLLLLPAGAFVLLAVLHERRLQQIRSRQRAIEFYERGIARVEDRWPGTGETGDRFLDPAHPYARDLDLFGQASLFELLCTARTRAGEEKLAAWLLAAGPVEEIVARHGAVGDLSVRVKLREKLFCLGETVRAGVKPDALAKWGERKPILKSNALRITTTVLCVLWIAGMVAWGLWGLGAIALAISALNLAWAHRMHARWDEAAEAIEEATHDLEFLQVSSDSLITANFRPRSCTIFSLVCGMRISFPQMRFGSSMALWVISNRDGILRCGCLMR